MFNYINKIINQDIADEINKYEDLACNVEKYYNIDEVCCDYNIDDIACTYLKFKGFINNKKKEGKWIIGFISNNDDTKNQYFYIEIYFINDNAHGIYKIYYENNIIYEEGTFNNGILDGVYKIYFNDNYIKEEGIYKNNEKNGPYKMLCYDADEEEGNYKDNKKNGSYKKYNNNKLYSEGNYDNDEKHGIEIQYKSDGKTIHKKLNYVNGILNGPYIEYYSKYKIEGIYENGNTISKNLLYLS
jgi:antitoxin component YwqK of YwqJK toxin-antitoxin module